MNQEFNNSNNRPDEYTDGNQEPNNSSTDNDLSQSNQQGSNYNYYSGYYNPYGSTNQDNVQLNHNPYQVYPTSQVMEERKPKKKSKIVGIVTLTAAAVVFGIIAGAVFQGYNLMTGPKTSERVADSNAKIEIQIAEISADPKVGDVIFPTNSSADAVITDVSDVVTNVMPSIVAINSSATVTSYDFFGRQFDEPVGGSGSGIIIGQNKSELLIVTNNHVIVGAETVEIVFADETTATAIVKGAEASSDLAVLSVDLKELSKETTSAIKVATIGNSDEVKAGEMAIAIGNALGFGQSVTVGYISAVDREVTLEELTMTLLQTDAAINPGNSGGALINTEGQVIGINSVKFASQEVEGMGYAIPISDAVPMINELMNREVLEKGEQGFLGIDLSTAQNVTEVYAVRFNMPIGVYIKDILPGSPAEVGGLTQGDIITGVNDTKVETIDDLINILSYKKAGETIDLIIQAKDMGTYVEKTLVITLGNRE